MKPRMSGLMKKEATRSILASILSIIIGLVVGCVIILIVGMTSDTLSPSSAWDGIRLILTNIIATMHRNREPLLHTAVYLELSDGGYLLLQVHQPCDNKF